MLKQSDQHLYFIIPKNFKTVASPVAEEDGLSLTWSQTPEDRFSPDVAHIMSRKFYSPDPHPTNGVECHKNRKKILTS